LYAAMHFLMMTRGVVGGAVVGGAVVGGVVVNVVDFPTHVSFARLSDKLDAHVPCPEAGVLHGDPTGTGNWPQ